MEEILKSAWMLVKIGCFTATITGVIVWTTATICRWMKWAPININVNLNSDDR